MARAGFTAIHSGRIRFGKDGRWYCDGEPLSNPSTRRLYARTITVGPDGRARLELGEDRAEVEIEDTPWVVTTVEGDAQRGFTVVLNDETREPRVLRNAWYELVRHAEPGVDDTCVLRAGPQRVALPSRTR